MSIKNEVPEVHHALSAVKEYCNIRDELEINDVLIFRGERFVVPRGMKHSMISDVHLGHSGVGGYLRLARESMYWS